MATEDLKVTVTRMHKLNGDGALKAFCDISVLDSLVINGLRVVEGKEGLFVGMPQETGKDGKWYNTVIPLRREVKDEIERVVLEAYGG
ncbi:MAG: SpoVG family protein [Candidatus Omnitrophica bacterium]|nr:SpoVG family protein [Candidatus Omnitrophota bacterium]